MGQDDGKCMPMLCLKDKRTKRLAATFVPSKGTDAYAIKFFAGFIDSTGYRKIINKSDGEHSIVALKHEAAKQSALQVGSVSQEIPPDDHQGLG